MGEVFVWSDRLWRRIRFRGRLHNNRLGVGVNVIQFEPYLERRRQRAGGIVSRGPLPRTSPAESSAVPSRPPCAHPPQQDQSDPPRPASLFLWDDGLGNRTVELGGRWDADESDLDCVLLQLILKWRRGGFRQ